MTPGDNQEAVNQAIGTLLSELPVAVQEFLTGPERDRVVLDLVKKYGLHADQAGDLERALIFMLLGISSPQEFMSALQSAGITPADVEGITKDVNEQIFVPLRKKEEQLLPMIPQQPSRPAAPIVPPLNVRMQAQPQTTGPVRSPAFPTAVPVPRPAPAPSAPATPAPKPMPPAPLPRPGSANPVAPQQAPAPSPQKQELHEVLKNYGVDPYREVPE